MNKFAFELLFRSNSSNKAEVLDNQFATAKVMTDVLNNFGLDALIGPYQAFINVDYDFLMDPVIETLPPKRFVLEVLEHVKVDEKLITRITDLKNMGFTIAVDDFDFTEEMFENFAPVLDIASIVKVDLTTIESVEAMRPKLERLTRKKLKLLAEKVETKEEFKLFKDLGYHYFQGYFFARPTIVEGKKLNPAKMTVIKLIGMINGEADIKSIEKEFDTAPALAVNLLKYLNSAAFSFRQDMSSIRQAVNLIGRGPLGRWLTLFVYADKHEQFHNNPLLDMAMIRAETMGALAAHMKLDKEMVDKAYLIGLLSFMECIMHSRFDEIFKQIRFDKEIVNSLMHATGPLGNLLTVAVALEQDTIEDGDALFKELNLTPGSLSEIMLKCYQKVQEGEMVD